MPQCLCSARAWLDAIDALEWDQGAFIACHAAGRTSRLGSRQACQSGHVARLGRDVMVGLRSLCAEAYGLVKQDNPRSIAARVERLFTNQPEKCFTRSTQQSIARRAA